MHILYHPMCYNGRMDKNFRVRVLCGFGLFALALLMMYTFDGVPFKIFFEIGRAHV